MPEEETCFTFIVGNYILYIIGAVVYFFCYCLLYSNIDRTDFVTWIDIIFIIVNLGWAIFGSISCWRESLENKVLRNPDVYEVFYNLASRMIYLRFSVLVIPAIMIICIFFIVLVTWTTSQEEDSDEEGVIKKIPLPGVVQKYLQSRARKYDITKECDKEVENCVICFESFKNKGPDGEDRPVAELNCSNKHIFHVHCLQKWSEVN